MDLKKVKRGRALHWPAHISDAQNRLRCEAGAIIDLDAPLERDVLCAGQLYKLQDAPEGTTAADIAQVQFRPAANLIRDERERLAGGDKKKAKKDTAKSGLGIDAPVEPTSPAKDEDDEVIVNVSAPKKPERKSGGK